MRDDEPPVVEHEVRHEPVAPVPHLAPEVLTLTGELGQCRLQSVAHADIAPVERPDQLVLVITRHRERVPGARHAHRQAQDPDAVRSSIDEVPDEHDAPAFGVPRIHRPPLCVPHDLVAELAEQLEEFLKASVHVTDDVEGSVFVAQIVGQALADHLRRLDLLDPAQGVHDPETLALQTPQAAPQLVVVPSDDTLAEVPVGPRLVARHGHRHRHVEHDRHRQHVVRPRELDELAAGLARDVRRVDDREPAGGEPLACDVAEHVEGVLRRVLIVLVVAHHPATHIAREHLVRPEVPRREGRLARPGDADERDETQLRDRDVAHEVTSVTDASATRRKSASWVGAPRSGSGSPTPRTCAT